MIIFSYFKIQFFKEIFINKIFVSKTGKNKSPTVSLFKLRNLMEMLDGDGDFVSTKFNF